MRITIAIVNTEIEIAGRMNWLRLPIGSSQGWMYVSGGTQPKTREVKSSSSVASQKLGMLSPIRPPTRAP